MPKKSNKWWGRSNNRGDENKSYYSHDDRVTVIRRHGKDRPHGPYGYPAKHRVSFKNQRPNMFHNLDGRDNQGRHGRDRPYGPHGPVEYRAPSNRGHDSIPGMSRKRNFKGGPPNDERFTPARANWYRVCIPYGHKYERDLVINALSTCITPDVCVPIMYKTSATDASFYIDDYKTAIALHNCDYKIKMSDGFKLKVKVKPGFPVYDINDELKERLKQAMVKRYLQNTNALNLSKFHLDPDLCSDYFCPLFHPVMLTTVLDIVAEHVPSLEALSLEGNQLQNIKSLGMLKEKFSKLKILHINDNKIRDMYQLDTIKDLKLDELKLTGNPVCDKYKSRQHDYVSDVQKRFPKLLRLDGTELPRPIVFDMVDESVEIPPTQRSFVTDAKAQQIASQFLQQYFTIFDSENREPLLAAYKEHACCSATINTVDNKWDEHHLENRNLFRISDSVKRQKFLKHGRLPVVSFLSQMPRTRHLSSTFTMDISLVTQTMMFITITGYFQQLDNKEEPIRFFNRTFIIVPEGEGCCILNEQLHISQPSQAELKQLHQQLNQINAQQTQSETLSSTKVTEPDDEVKKQMTLELSQQTNMNLEWSSKCLQDMHWNYDNAISAFHESYKSGQIPLKAFARNKDT